MTAAAKTPFISVVIPTLNEERRIGRCLQALAEQDYPKSAFEVILVDNGSTDRTESVAQTFSNALTLSTLRKPGARVSAVRNFGAAKARGAFLAFLDADCIAPRHWLGSAAETMGRDRLGALGSHFMIPEESTWVARAWYGDLSLERKGDLEWVPCCDMIMPREIFNRLGGFDETLETNEEFELCHRIRSSGLRVVADPAVAVVHLGTPQTLAQFYAKDRWHATDGLRVFLRTLPKITNPRPLLFGAYSLACVAGIGIGAAIAAWTRRFGLLAFFLAALLTPSLLLSIRMAIRRGQWASIPPLTLLHLAFGLARGHALLDAAGLGKAGRANDA